MKRRHFLQLAASAASTAAIEHAFALPSFVEKISLRIAPVTVELAPGIVVRATGYNGQSPGPILRMRARVPAALSITNATQCHERMHWQGVRLSSSGVDHLQTGDPEIEPGATRTYHLTTEGEGSCWYRAYASTPTDLMRAAGSGQFGFLWIDPGTFDGAFDQEVFLAIHHWEPSLPSAVEGHEQRQVTYRYASFNDRLLGANEPIRVRFDERVLFHFLNSSATEDACIHLPGHRFIVVALDGHPVPKRAAVDVLSLTKGERVDVLVEMNSPGKWLLGSVDDAERARGLGVHIEYENQNGLAQWHAPAAFDWSYARFSALKVSPSRPDYVLKLLLEKSADSRDRWPRWIFDGQCYHDLGFLPLQPGRRYRLRMMNATDQVHSVNLRHHSFELTRVHHVPVSGIIKDTIRLDRYNVIEADVRESDVNWRTI